MVAPGVARAHVSIASGPGFANTTQEITFGVGHGCAGADTVRVRVEIPPDVLSVRPLRSDFGKVSVEKDAAGTITAVTWQKADADALDTDIAYDKLIVRLKVPNKPFTTSFFKAHQTCRAMDGTLSTVDWAMLPGDPIVDGGAADEPAPALVALLVRQPGWNKYVVAQAVPDVAGDLRRRADRVEGDGGLQRELCDGGADRGDPGCVGAERARGERRDLGEVLMRVRVWLAAALLGASWSAARGRKANNVSTDGGPGGNGGNVGNVGLAAAGGSTGGGGATGGLAACLY